MKRLLLLLLACFVATYAQDIMTNDTIIRMVQSGVPAATIIRTIQSSPTFDFRFTPNELQRLGQSAVPEEVLKAMAAKSGSSSGANRAPVSTVADNTAEYFHRGMKEIDIDGSVSVPHIDASGTSGFGDVGFGYSISRGSQIGLAASGIFLGTLAQDAFVDGFYRYYFKTGNPRFLPFLGGAAGINVAHLSGTPTVGNLLVEATGGIRYFVARHTALEVGYHLVYVNVKNATFQESSSSEIAIGFAHVFGK